MSKKQRRGHKPIPGQNHQGIYTCTICGERIRLVMGYGVPDYWRHWRRA